MRIRGGRVRRGRIGIRSRTYNVQPNGIPRSHGTVASRHMCVEPRGTAPGLTHPDTPPVAIHATVKRPCAPADGTRGPHGLFTNVGPYTVRPCGWVNPGPTARGLP